jgi:hypothetical protein
VYFGYVYCGGCVFITKSNMGLCMSVKVSFICSFVCLDYICESVQLCLIIGLSFRHELFLMCQ